MTREKQLTITLLKEKIEKLSGKRVVFESLEKEAKVKKLIESLEKISGKKVIFENDQFPMKEEELEEGMFGPSEEDLRKSFLSTIPVWVKKGYKKPTQAEFDAIMAQAKTDKLKGKLGVDKEKNIIYRPFATINMVPGAGHTFGGGAGN